MDQQIQQTNKEESSKGKEINEDYEGKFIKRHEKIISKI
jgi:hypothetical protein